MTLYCCVTITYGILLRIQRHKRRVRRIKTNLFHLPLLPQYLLLPLVQTQQTNIYSILHSSSLSLSLSPSSLLFPLSPFINDRYRPSQPQPQPPTAQPANNTTLFAQPMVKKGTTTTATTTTTPASATPPTLTEAEQRKRERAGGYHEEYIRLRAIQEAFAALWIPSNDIIENNNNRLLDNKYDDNAMRIS